MERLICASSSALVASTSFATEQPRASRRGPQQQRRRRRRSSSSSLSTAVSSSSLPPSPAASRPLLRSILITTTCSESPARPVRVLASSEESQGAGGEPLIASTSSPTIPSTPSSSSSSSPPAGAALAAAAATLGVVLFAVTRLSTGGVTLADVAALSVPLDAARASGKPTIVEFYADYCDVCKQLAPDSAAVARKYSSGAGGNGASSSSSSSSSSPSDSTSADSRALNFVLLNADNARWSPEVAEFGVRGVPHFVFLGADGAAKGAAVGRLPPGELEADAADLVEGRPLAIGSTRRNSAAVSAAGAGAAPSSAGLGEVTLLRGEKGGGANPPAPRAHG